MKKVMIIKFFINKKNKQLTVPLSRKQIKKIEPTLKFDKDLFVELKILTKRKK